MSTATINVVSAKTLINQGFSQVVSSTNLSGIVLNRRGRLARFLVVLSLAVVLLAALAYKAGAGDVASVNPVSGSTSYVVLTVGSGDSIWSIARTVADGRDVRSVVDATVTANSLSDGNVSAGQKIRVPLA